jgi:hypothetical protein
MPGTWTSSISNLLKSVLSNPLIHLIQNAQPVHPFVCIIRINKWMWSPLHVPDSMGIRPHEASRMKLEIQITTITSRLAAANEAIIVDEGDAIAMRVFCKNNLSMYARI